VADRVGINKRVADRLYADGRIAEDEYLRIVDYARRKKLRVEEALIELGVIAEDALLKYVATLHKTQFVSTARMAKAKVDREALRVVPKGLAQHYGIYPLVLDRKNDKLIIATPDPDNLQALQELKMGAKVKSVAAMVARPEAVVAAIERGYDGSKKRFERLLDKKQSQDFNELFMDRDAPAAGRRGFVEDNMLDHLSAEERRRYERGTGRVLTGEFAPPRRTTGNPLDGGRAGTGGGPARRPPAIDDPWAEEDFHDPRAVRPTPGADAGGQQRFRETESGGGNRFRETEGGGRRPSGRGRPPTGIGDEPSHAFDDGYVERDAPRARHRMTPAEMPYGYDDEDVRRDRPSTGRRLEDQRRHAPVGTVVGGAAESDPNRPSRKPLPRRDRPPTTQVADGLAPDLDSKPSFARAAGLNRQAARSPIRKPRAGGVERVAKVGASSEPGTKRKKKRSSLIPRPLGLGPMSTRSGEPTGAEVFGAAAYQESLRVLVGLLENERSDLRGHSGIVAQLVANMCERINLTEGEARPIVLASYLHDLGKMGEQHLTALNVAQMEDHFDLAGKVVKLPAQLMESVGLPDAMLDPVRRMYERVGGGGIPDGLQAKDIPIGARILALADSYADLTRNRSNPYERVLSPEEAMDVLRQHAGTVFDPNLVEVLEKASGGEKILTDLLANRHRVLVVDPDPEETMVLQLRLVEQGFDVHVARNTSEAEQALEQTSFALIVSEVDLESESAGFALREKVSRSHPDASWVFLSSRESREVVERALKLGVDDFQAKPVSHEILVAKLTQLVERKSQREAPRGVSGSLAQMGIPEIVQILWHGRKTCALNLTQGSKQGQVHFVEGQIVNAIWDEATGETAFYRLLTLGEEGEFAVDPEFQPTEQVIHASPEGLLLEGMRLLDEGAIP